MITRLEVDGFKSLQGFAVDLEPFTVLIGPNSAGKSNILEALALLSRLVTQPIADAFRNGRGRPSDQFTRTGATSVHAMSFAVEFLTYGVYRRKQPLGPYRQSRHRYELTIERQTLSSGAELLVATAERLLAMRSVDDPWIAAHPEFSRCASYHDEGSDLLASLAAHQAAFLGATDAPANDSDESRAFPFTALSQLTSVFGSAQPYNEIRGLVADLALCRTLKVDVAHLGEPSDRLDSRDLAADAANLPTVLAVLPKPLLGEIRADLVALVPGISSFEIVVEGDEIHIDFQLSGGDRMPARLVSDGTLRLLVLLTALRLQPRPPIVCLEEPENGIFPGRLRALLELFLAESQRSHDDADALVRIEARGLNAHTIHTNLLPTQFILTTHSPVLLAALRQTPQRLRFIDTVRRDGHRVTRVRAVGRVTRPEQGRHTVSPREIEQFLDAAKSEEPA